MHRDRHVGGLSFQCRAHDGGINRRQLVRVIATRLRLLALIRIAHHGPGGVIKLQVAATRVIESADCLAPRSSDIREKLIDVRVDVLAHQRASLPEMKGAGSRNAHFRDDLAMRFQKPEMFNLLMAGELYLLGNLDSFLLPHDLFDLAVFDGGQCGGIDFVPRPLGARFLERSGSQQATDMIGAKRRSLALRHDLLSSPILRLLTRRSSAAWPIVRPRRARCPPRSKQSRTAETGTTGRVPQIWLPLRSAF